MSQPSVPMIYLARGGETSGPFTVEQIDQLRARGELKNYTWIRDERFSAQWQPIDPAPMPGPPTAPISNTAPVNGAAHPEPASVSVISPPTAPSIAPSVRRANPDVGVIARSSSDLVDLLELQRKTDSEIEAICHNHQELVGGIVRNVSELGCEFIVPVAHAEELSSPVFSKQSRVMINLMHAESEFMTNLPAQLANCFRRDRQWVYHFMWG